MFGIKTYFNPSCYRGGGGGGDASHDFVIGTYCSYQWMLSVDGLKETSHLRDFIIDS